MQKKRRISVTKEVARLAVEIQEELGVEMLRCEYVTEAGRKILRIIINKEGGVTISDCEAFSRNLSGRLDEEDFIQEHYYLEVSSPGI